MSEQNDLQSFYYTFGTSEHFPYQKGCVEVKAPNRHAAYRLFRKHHPDHTEGILNCAFVYDQKEFEDMLRHRPQHRHADQNGASGTGTGNSRPHTL